MPLDDYFRKRNPQGSPEPFDDEDVHPHGETTHGAFVVHEHDARRKHYDLRLEHQGVLASFAVPKGPTLNPDERRLAIHTEDHPLAYVDFEDVIPDGAYGAGPMIVWDRGAVTYVESTFEAGLKKGKVDFVLAGFKLRGRFALVKTKGGPSHWLLLKKKDAYVEPGEVVDRKPHSVLSSLTVVERGDVQKKAEKLFREPSRARTSTPSYEPMMTGVLVRATVRGGRVSLVSTGSENETDIAACFPDVVRALGSLGMNVTLSGELGMFTKGGAVDHTLLRARFERAMSLSHIVATPAVFLVHDALCVDGRDLSQRPRPERKALLETLLPGAGLLRVVPSLGMERGDMEAFVKAHALFGYLECGVEPPVLHVAARPTSLESIVSEWRAGGPKPLPFVITNKDKVFFPKGSITKGDVCAYYEAVAPALLPYLKDRPVILVRYPDGVNGKHFYQWNVPPGAPSFIQMLELPPRNEGKHGKRTFLIQDAASLVYLGNLGVLPVHLLACRKDDLGSADFLTIDLDVELSNFATGVMLAHALREIAERVGLVPFVKTSGQGGLHVLMPLGPSCSFDTARGLADLLGRMLVQACPELATMERVIAKRGAKVYVDTGQVGPSRAIVAPYALRATEDATVSTPLPWDELVPTLDPRAWTLRTVPARIQKGGDPWRAFFETSVDLPHVVKALEGIFRAKTGPPG